MYKWTGKGVLRHGGKIVVNHGEIIPNGVPEHTIKSLLKKGTAELVSEGKKPSGKGKKSKGGA